MKSDESRQNNLYIITFESHSYKQNCNKSETQNTYNNNKTFMIVFGHDDRQKSYLAYKLYSFWL